METRNPDASLKSADSTAAGFLGLARASQGVCGIEPDFTLVEALEDWASSWVLLPHNGIRSELSSCFRALRGIQVLRSSKTLTAQHFKKFFSWFELFESFVLDYIDFDEMVLHHVILERVRCAESTSDANHGEDDVLLETESMHRVLRTKLAEICSLRKRVGLGDLDMLAEDVLAHVAVFTVRVLELLRRKETLHIPIVSNLLGPWDLPDLVDAKRRFYDRLQGSNSYVRMLVMATSWQTKEEQRVTRSLYLHTVRQKLLFTVVLATQHKRTELLRDLFNASERPMRSFHPRKQLSGRTGSTITADGEGCSIQMLGSHGQLLSQERSDSGLRSSRGLYRRQSPAGSVSGALRDLSRKSSLRNGRTSFGHAESAERARRLRQRHQRISIDAEIEQVKRCQSNNSILEDQTADDVEAAQARQSGVSRTNGRFADDAVPKNEEAGLVVAAQRGETPQRPGPADMLFRSNTGPFNPFQRAFTSSDCPELPPVEIEFESIPSMPEATLVSNECMQSKNNARRLTTAALPEQRRSSPDATSSPSTSPRNDARNRVPVVAFELETLLRTSENTGAMQSLTCSRRVLLGSPR